MEIEASSSAVEKEVSVEETVSVAPHRIHGNITVVWIGRFLRSGGYGVATRSMYRALKEAGLHVVGIDVDTNRPIDDAAYPHFEVFGGGDQLLSLKAVSQERFVVVVFHETPPEWKRLGITGRCHQVGYTVTETEQIPFDWTRHLLEVDHLWVASDFNMRTFEAVGIPSNLMSVLPHAIDTDLLRPVEVPSTLPSTNSFRILSVVSNFNRKDIAGVVRSYVEAFKPTDDVTLVLKLPARFSQSEFQKYLLEAAYPWIDLSSKHLPHILLVSGHFADEKMIELYQSCHAYVSLERGKGWDLPSIEAMLVGLPCLGIDWGGNTFFQNRDNSVLLDPKSRTVFTGSDLVANRELYTGHTWAAYDVRDAAEGFRRLRNQYEVERGKTLEARASLESKVSLSAVAGLVVQYLEGLREFQFRSSERSQLVLAPSGRETVLDPKVRFAAYESLEEEPKSVIDQDWQKVEDVAEWVSRKRRIWGACGPVLTKISEQDRLRELKNRFYGESIFVIGNGPSLKKVDLNSLREYYTIAANKIYLLFDKTDWRPDFYTTLDWRVTPDNHEEINALSGMTFFFPHRFRGLLREGDDVFWYESISPGRSLLEKFEPDINKGARGGGTVLTAALQQAYYLGFRKFFLVGVDVSYSIPRTVIQTGGDRFGTGIQVNLQSTQDDDPNHFDPRYFGKGAKWHDPNVNEMMRGFQSAGRAISYLGGELYNSTIGGNLNCVRRMPLEEALKYAKQKNG